MKLCRLMIMVSILLTGYSIGLVGYRFTQQKDMTPWVFVMVVTALVGLAARRGYARLTAFGTARWATAQDLKKAGMLGSYTGLILGRTGDSRVGFFEALAGIFNPRVDSAEACQQFLYSLRRKNPMGEPLVRLAKAVHTAVFAPTGTGKGVSCVIPHLMTCPDSTVVVDFKGENARLTAKHRQKAFGHRIFILDPYKVVKEQPDTFNPLDFIYKDSATAIDDCRDLAEALVVRTGKETEPHWVDSAEVWIAAMAAVVVQYGEEDDRSLQTVRGLLTNPKKMEAVIKLMCESDVWDGMLSRLGHQLTHFKDKELGSTLTTTNRFLRFLDTLAILDSTKSSSFDPAQLVKGKTTVYLVLPPEHMRAQSPLLRMWIGAMLRAVVRAGLQEKNKVHFVLDEAASLGHMDALDDAVDKYRGYGVRLQFYYQSLGQLKKSFPEGQDQTLLSNATQVFFAVNDNDTAKYISERLGEETIVVESGGTSKGGSQSYSADGKGSTGSSWNRSDNWAQQTRKLLKPEEVIALSDRTAITFTPGVPPIWTTLARYFEEPNLGQRPGWLKRIRLWGSLMMGAVVLLVGASILAMAATESLKGQTPVYTKGR